MKQKLTKEKPNEIYALHFEGKLIEDRRKIWKQYTDKYGDRGRGLYGWKPPKALYFTLGRAKAAISHFPKEIQPLILIVKYIPDLENLEFKTAG